VEKSPERAKQVEHNLTQARLANKVEVRCGDAKEILLEFDKESLDAVFIDGNKADYPLYLERSYELLRPGGLLIADNTLLFGQVYQEDQPKGKMEKLCLAMQEFNLKAADERFESIMLPTEEGMVVAIKAGGYK
jgi:predicted O-methyltransferase YrrM